MEYYSALRRAKFTKRIKKERNKKERERGRNFKAHTSTQMNLEDIDGGGLVT